MSATSWPATPDLAQWVEHRCETRRSQVRILRFVGRESYRSSEAGARPRRPRSRCPHGRRPEGSTEGVLRCASRSGPIVPTVARRPRAPDRARRRTRRRDGRDGLSARAPHARGVAGRSSRLRGPSFVAVKSHERRESSRERGGVVIVILRRVKVLEHERALVFRNGAFEGVLAAGRPLDARPALPPAGGGRVDPERLAHPPGPRAHGEVGPSRPRGARRGPQDPPARHRLGGRPPRARAEAGRLRAVDGGPRRARRRRRRARRALRARAAGRGPGAAGHGRAARAGHGRGGPRGPALPRRPPRGDARPGRLRALEGRRAREGRAGRPARAGGRRRGPGDHDRRQGHAADERGRDLQGGRCRSRP